MKTDYYAKRRKRLADEMADMSFYFGYSGESCEKSL